MLHGALLAAFASAAPVLAQSAAPLRLASINLCTDQLLLDLAEPSQIVGLSPFSRDAGRSWFAGKVGDLPVLSGTAEEIVMLRPDQVLAGRFTKRATREFIRARAIPLDEFDPVRTLAQSRAQILRVARLVGAEAKGQARVAELDAALARLKVAAAKRPLTVLPLARRGWTAGRDSILTELLTEAGLINPNAASGARTGSLMSLEAIVQLRPDAILISRDGDKAEDQGSAILLHPAIAALFPPERRVVVSEAATICGGPMLVAAMDQLTAQIGRLRPRDVP